jgi:hypothetical protein
MTRNANQARRFFRHLAEQSRRRAADARRDAAQETDPAVKRNLEAMAKGHDDQAVIYDRRHDEVKDR